VSYSAIGIKFPLATYETIKKTLPPATVYRVLTSLTDDSSIEIFYILDNEMFSQAQLRWFANIKTIISRKLIDIIFELVELDKETNVRALSGENYTLRSLSNTWKSAKPYSVAPALESTSDSRNEWSEHEIIVDKFVDEVIKIPQLIPLTQGGKAHENLYRTLCIYCKRLHYEKLFIFEYLSLASNIYARDMSLLPKEVRKITIKAWEFISEQIELHPEDFKQKLTKQELQQVKQSHGKRLQKYNQQKRTNNKALVKDALSSGNCLKANGTLNIGAIAKTTKLNRKTVEKILEVI
jgi:hypothetical protein